VDVADAVIEQCNATAKSANGDSKDQFLLDEEESESEDEEDPLSSLNGGEGEDEGEEKEDKPYKGMYAVL
jgi:hypothetical protein